MTKAIQPNANLYMNLGAPHASNDLGSASDEFNPSSVIDGAEISIRDLSSMSSTSSTD